MDAIDGSDGVQSLAFGKKQNDVASIISLWNGERERAAQFEVMGQGLSFDRDGIDSTDFLQCESLRVTPFNEISARLDSAVIPFTRLKMDRT